MFYCDGYNISDTSTSRSCDGSITMKVGGHEVGNLLINGKSKQVFELLAYPGFCLLLSKDHITADDSENRAQLLQEIVENFNTITMQVFRLLSAVGIHTAYVKSVTRKAFLALNCQMIPIEWVTRRIAAGSFLRRNPDVSEGQRFSTLIQEAFFKDDSNHDIQISDNDIISAKFTVNSFHIGKNEVEILRSTSSLIFEILEQALATRNITLVDMKVEFGVEDGGDVLLADMIDSDTWRIWPLSDERYMIDKEDYGNLTHMDDTVLDQLKRNCCWITNQLNCLVHDKNHLVVILMGNGSDAIHCSKISTECEKLGLKTEICVISEFDRPEDILSIMHEYEIAVSDLVFIVVASRLNCLGKVPTGSIVSPVINCPPVQQYKIDVWSGFTCPTILLPVSAALHAAQILGLSNFMIWSRLRCKQLTYYNYLKLCDSGNLE